MFAVLVRVTNHGDRTAEAVQVLAELSRKGEVIEDGEQSVDFLAGGESQELQFVFSEDPSKAELEVRAACHIDARFDAEADRAGRAALNATGGEAVLVTRSAKGLTLARRGRPALHLPARAREVADVSGAGDTLVAALAVAMAAGAPLAEAAMLANVTAGISVGMPALS